MIEPFKIKNLVFSGGGQRGVAYVGCLRALRSLGVKLTSLHGVAGTSVGALFALALALHFTIEEIEEKVLHLNVQNILQIDLCELYHNHGLDNGDKVKEYICTLFHQKQCNPAITFHQFWMKTNIKFVVIGANLQTLKDTEFSYENTPTVPVIDAIMASISIPVLFTPKSILQSPHVYVDGGLINNFPINVFDSHDTLGIRLTCSSETDHDKYTSLVQYLSRVVYCILEQAEELQRCII